MIDREPGSVAFGGTTIAYTVVRSPRRMKTVEITLDHEEGVLVAAPVDTHPHRIADIVRRRGGWILKHANGTANHVTRKQLTTGESLPYLGRQVRLFVEPADVKRVNVRFANWSFRVSVPRDLMGEDRRTKILRALRQWYSHRASARIEERVSRWAPLLQCKPGRILIRDQRKRWGSCGADGTLRFNWRTVQLEPTLIDYVVVHELAHLFERNHNARYWEAVASTMPDYRLRRQRLKEAGAMVVL